MSLDSPDHSQPFINRRSVVLFPFVAVITGLTVTRFSRLLQPDQLQENSVMIDALASQLQAEGFTLERSQSRTAQTLRIEIIISQTADALDASDLYLLIQKLSTFVSVHNGSRKEFPTVYIEGFKSNIADNFDALLADIRLKKEGESAEASRAEFLRDTGTIGLVTLACQEKPSGIIIRPQRENERDIHPIQIRLVQLSDQSAETPPVQRKNTSIARRRIGREN